MKINEIILLEDEAELRQELGQEFDDEYGNPKLPQFIMLDKASVVALAVGYYKRPLWTAGTVGGRIGNKNAYKGDGSFKNSKFNPLAGTDQSSLRKSVGSGIAKARSNFKNSDTFRLKKS